MAITADFLIGYKQTDEGIQGGIWIPGAYLRAELGGDIRHPGLPKMMEVFFTAHADASGPPIGRTPRVQFTPDETDGGPQIRRQAYEIATEALVRMGVIRNVVDDI